MRTLLTLAILSAFTVVGTALYGQDEGAGAKPGARPETVAPPAKDEAAPDAAPDRIAEIRRELAELEARRRELRAELRELQGARGGPLRLRDLLEDGDAFGFHLGPQGGFSIDMDDLAQGFAGRLRAIPGAPGESNGVSIQAGPDGVKVEITETDDNGRTETKTYEADSIEAFRTEHPELAEKYGIGEMKFGSGLAPFEDLNGFGDLRERMEEMRRRFQGDFGSGFDAFGGRPLAPRAAPPAAPGRERLGVLVRPVDPARLEALNLAAGEGLVIENVEPGTLAARLGLRPGDTLLRINGETIRGAATIATALGAATDRDPITLEVERKSGERATLEALKGAPRLKSRKI
ncbi:MAG: PDZ domain-containing protein [Planctomycetota bacterium]